MNMTHFFVTSVQNLSEIVLLYLKFSKITRVFTKLLIMISGCIDSKSHAT